MDRPRLRIFAPLLPYAAVLVGMFFLHSAWVTLLGYHIGILGILSLAKLWSKAKNLVRTQRGMYVLVGITVGALGGAVLYLLWPVLHISIEFGGALSRLGLSGPAWIVFIAYFFLVNPWLEEFYWRVYLGSDRRLPAWADAWFSGYHLLVLAPFIGPIWLLVVFLVLAGSAWFWRQLGRWSAGWLPVVLSHMAADLSLILVIYHFSQVIV